jgi:hypothetical protein
MLTSRRLIELGFIRKLYKGEHEYYQKGRLILVPFLDGWLCGVDFDALMVGRSSFIKTEDELKRLLNNQ